MQVKYLAQSVVNGSVMLAHYNHGLASQFKGLGLYFKVNVETFKGFKRKVTWSGLQ